MKVMLTAFGEVLKSEVMEWPEETPPTIHLQVNMDPFKALSISGVIPSLVPRQGVGRFIRRPGCSVVDGHEVIHYILTEWRGR